MWFWLITWKVKNKILNFQVVGSKLVKIIRSYFLTVVNLNLTKNWKHIHSFVLCKTSNMSYMVVQQNIKHELHGCTQNHARHKMTSLMKLDWSQYNILYLSLYPKPLVMGISHYMFFPTQKVQSLMQKVQSLMRRSLCHS